MFLFVFGFGIPGRFVFETHNFHKNPTCAGSRKRNLGLRVSQNDQKVTLSDVVFWPNLVWGRYCWWTKSCTTWDNPINNGIIIILGGAGFCPSTVFWDLSFFVPNSFFSHDVVVKFGRSFVFMAWKTPTKFTHLSHVFNTTRICISLQLWRYQIPMSFFHNLDQLEEWSHHQDLARSRSIYHAFRVTAVTRKWYTNEGRNVLPIIFFEAQSVQLNLIPRAITFNLPNGRHGEFQRGKIGNLGFQRASSSTFGGSCIIYPSQKFFTQKPPILLTTGT